jgi:hypothetical protein
VLEANDAAETRELVRGLVESIRLIPEPSQLRTEVRGEMGPMLGLAEGAGGARNGKRPGVVAEAFYPVMLGQRTGFPPRTELAMLAVVTTLCRARSSPASCLDGFAAILGLHAPTGRPSFTLPEARRGSCPPA